MKTGLTRHLTPGNAVAMIALIVALGGTAVAASTLADASVTTPKLANSAVTGAKVAKGTLEASDFKPNVLGGISSSKVTIVTGTPVTVPPNNNGTTATATCPAGQRAISALAMKRTGPTAFSAKMSSHDT